jgi:ketosteroid isomerase-like protein
MSPLAYMAINQCGTGLDVWLRQAKPIRRDRQMTHQAAVTIDTLKEILDAFNRHDVDAIMRFFDDDCSFDIPRGPESFGTRLVGKDQVHQGFVSRFAGIPDVQYGEDRHFVSGDRGASEWRLTGTTTAGKRVDVRGCDLWEFANGKVIRKDSYWKIVD